MNIEKVADLIMRAKLMDEEACMELHRLLCDTGYSGILKLLNHPEKALALLQEAYLLIRHLLLLLIEEEEDKSDTQTRLF